MKFKYFLLLYGLLAVNFCGFKMFAIEDINQSYVIIMAMIVFGFLYPFKKSAQDKQLSRIGIKSLKRHIFLFHYFGIGILISMFTCFVFWGQAISQSIITYRFLYTILFFPMLLKACPKEEDFFYVVRIIAYLSVIAWLCSIFIPSFVNVDIESLELNKETGDIGRLNSGYSFIPIYCYILMNNLIKRFNSYEFITLMGFILAMVFMQNRSMLLGVILIFVYVLFYKLRSIKLIYKVLLIVTCALIIFSDPILQIVNSLVKETTDQIGDSDYNRNKALYFYFFEYSPNWLCYIFGNGMPSLGNSDYGVYMEKIGAIGISASDLGLIGCWGQFGLLPLIVIYYICYKIIVGRYPYYMKFLSLHISLIPTIWGFWHISGTFLFSILFYLFALQNAKMVDSKFLSERHINE